MKSKELDEKTRIVLRKMQNNEYTEHKIYAHIASRQQEGKNREILLKISEDEKNHAKLWEKYTGTPSKANWLRVYLYRLIGFLFGFTFTLKYMEKKEEAATGAYLKLIQELPEARKASEEEEQHEAKLLSMLDEERLQYVGSMVLGLNDALVELTGTLAGLTFALRNNKLVALSGLITGISATLSMASSEFLAARSQGKKDALKSCVYTGVAYLITVTLLVLPYLLLPAGAFLYSLLFLLISVVLIIFVFNYYLSVAQGGSFRKRFGEMAAISLGVAALSFVIGLLVKQFLGVDVG